MAELTDDEILATAIANEQLRPVRELVSGLLDLVERQQQMLKSLLWKQRQLEEVVKLELLARRE